MGGQIGRKVRLGVLSRGHEIPSGGRPASGRDSAQSESHSQLV
jgi:hypothetical protein